MTYPAIAKRMLLTAVLCLTCLLLATISAAAVDYDTLHYRVELSVKENYSFEITERITVDFHQPAHGIYRDIPIEGDSYYLDDRGEVQTAKVRLRIRDARGEGGPLEVSKEDGYTVLKLGDPHKTVTGQVTYVLSYVADLYDDGIEAFDQVYWNLLPHRWDSPVEEASFRVELPRDFDVDQVAWYAGAVGSQEEDQVAWYKEGRVLEGSLERQLFPGEGVTLRILLPQGYFTGVKSDVPVILAGLAAAILASLAAFVLYLRYGRDEKIVPVVEFYPPDGLSPAEAGYLLDGVIQDDELLALIPYFAWQGHLFIQQVDTQKRLLRKDKEVLEIQKIRDLPPSAPAYQKRFFDALFASGPSFLTTDPPSGFAQAFEETKSALEDHFKKKGQTLYDKSSGKAQGLGCLLMFVPFLVFAAYAVLDLYFDTPMINRATFIVLPASLVVTGLFTVAMRKRTAYRTQLLGRLMGFKNFIRAAELDRIKALVNQDPHYFYHILPYAFVFGLTEQWIDNFKGLKVEQPAWYRSDGAMLFSPLALTRSMGAVNQSLPTIAPSSGSSFSGGGSGGFSGGGGGGGGGGAW